ncbi:MAG: hypothetical protein ACO29V_13015 [Limnohabitans sp.]
MVIRSKAPSELVVYVLRRADGTYFCLPHTDDNQEWSTDIHMARPWVSFPAAEAAKKLFLLLHNEHLTIIRRVL